MAVNFVDRCLIVVSFSHFQVDFDNKEKKPKKILKNIQPILYLLKWLGETDYENTNQQLWLCENLRSVCGANIQNKMLCCQSGLIFSLVQTLSESHSRLDGKSVIELLLLLKSLGKALYTRLTHVSWKCQI